SSVPSGRDAGTLHFIGKSQRLRRCRPENLSGRGQALPLVEIDLETARGLGGGLDIDVDPADLALVGGLDLDFPLARLVMGLDAVAAKTLLAPADDVDRDRVLQPPEIGRASCRERGEDSVGGRGSKKK